MSQCLFFFGQFVTLASLKVPSGVYHSLGQPTHQQDQRDEDGDDEGGHVLVPEDVVRVGAEGRHRQLVGGAVDGEDGAVGRRHLHRPHPRLLDRLEVQRAHEGGRHLQEEEGGGEPNQ